MPELVVTTNGVEFAGHPLVLAKGRATERLADTLDQALIHARGPEYEQWFRYASTGGHLDYWVKVRIDARVTMRDLAAVLSQTGRSTAVAVAIAPGGAEVLVGFDYQGNPPQVAGDDVVLRASISSTGSIAVAATPVMPYADAIRDAEKRARDKQTSLYVIVNATPDARWGDVISALALAGPLVHLPYPFRIPYVVLD